MLFILFCLLHYNRFVQITSINYSWSWPYINSVFRRYIYYFLSFINFHYIDALRVFMSTYELVYALWSAYELSISDNWLEELVIILRNYYYFCLPRLEHWSIIQIISQFFWCIFNIFKQAPGFRKILLSFYVLTLSSNMIENITYIFYSRVIIYEVLFTFSKRHVGLEKYFCAFAWYLIQTWCK